MPELEELVIQAKQNKETWKTYEETEKDKKVYTCMMPADAFADHQEDPLSLEYNSDEDVETKLES